MSSESANIKDSPGYKLRHKLGGHVDWIYRIAWSPDGRRLASPSYDRTIRIWDVNTGSLQLSLEGHTAAVYTVSWSPDGKKLASGSDDNTILIWDAENGGLLRVLEAHSNWVNCVEWSPDGHRLASSSADRTIKIWDADQWQILREVSYVPSAPCGVAWSPDGTMLASGYQDKVIRIWGVEAGELIRVLSGHTDWDIRVAWSADGQVLASGANDHTIRIWNPYTGQQLVTFEGHTGMITSVAFSCDGRLLASKAQDVRVWRCDRWELVTEIEEETPRNNLSSIAFHPTAPVLATLGDSDTIIRIWDLDLAVLLGEDRQTDTVHYANAKVVLVGDSGVGKSGLALVLSDQEFKPTDSTHGRHVWPFESSESRLDDKRTETRETLLWDLAGQPGYRLIHQLHLDEAAVALVVFDSRSETDPLAGVHYWHRALRQAHRTRGDNANPMKKILVAARIDRGRVGLSPARIESVVRDFGFDGYFETSAKEGWGVNELSEAIRQAIEWDSLPKVSSTELFQRIKSFLLEEKESGRLLSRTDDLFRTLIKSDNSLADGEGLRAQFSTCVRLVEARGLIRRLTFGDLVLLQPELLDAYASAIIDAAKQEPDGLGSIAEEAVRLGRFDMSDDERIKDGELEGLLLIATIEELLRHELALREQSEGGWHLVFPSQFTRENPDLPYPENRAVIFNFEGPIQNIYTTLAVRLSRSGIFGKKDMWKNAATYTTITDGVYGMALREIDEGRGELVLFFDGAAGKDLQRVFEEYVFAHLRRRALSETVERRRAVICAVCGFALSQQLIRLRTERGFDWLDCPVCNNHIPIVERAQQKPVGASLTIPQMDIIADHQCELDSGLISAVGEMHTRSFKQWAGGLKVILTLIFTDIVGSTALGVELGDEAMGEVRHAHFARARQLIKKCDGYEIKTIGDSFMVAFRAVVDALNFALELYADTGHKRVRVRAGIHVGQVRIEEEDAYGHMVNYTARVEARAQGAGIWMSDIAKVFFEQEKPRALASLSWTEHPDCELKGFPGKQRLWSVDL
jgi:WD40 repeat protein/class 3 adenylate cyclase